MINVKTTSYIDIKNLKLAVQEAQREPLKKAMMKVRDYARKSLKQGPTTQSLTLADFLPGPLKPFAAMGRTELFRMAAQIGIPKQIIYAAMKKLKQGKRRPVPSKPGTPPHSQTGKLKKSIITEQDKETGDARVGLAKEGWYGRLHEFSSSKHPKRPFLKPALLHEMNRFPKEFQNMKLASTVAGKKLNRRKKV